MTTKNITLEPKFLANKLAVASPVLTSLSVVAPDSGSHCRPPGVPHVVPGVFGWKMGQNDMRKTEIQNPPVLNFCLFRLSLHFFFPAPPREMLLGEQNQMIDSGVQWSEDLTSSSCSKFVHCMGQSETSDFFSKLDELLVGCGKNPTINPCSSHSQARDPLILYLISMILPLAAI
jgi:hypothetical protein